MFRVQQQNNKPENYHTNRLKTYEDVAKELNVSVSLSCLIEDDIFLKFALFLFSPPWAVKHHSFRRLKDATENFVRFDQGKYAEVLADVVRSAVGTNDIRMFKTEYERRIVDISKHVEFRKLIVEILRGDG